jgi:hypothetical protein
MRHEELEDEIISVERLAPIVEPGEYWAVVTGVKRVLRFGHAVAQFRFKVVTMGSAYGVHLNGYCTLPIKKKDRVPAGSKFGSWTRTLTAFTGCSPSRISLGGFKGFWLTVKVETVTRNHRQQRLALRDQYSVVSDIVDVVGKISELPPSNDQPNSHPQDEDAL